MKPLGVRAQFVQDELYSADGAIAAGPVSTLVLPRSKSRSYLFIQNISNQTMNFEIGGARAAATLTNGAVTSIAVTNGGFGYVKTPRVYLFGGGPVDGNSGTGVGAGQPTWGAPSNQATAVATVAAGIVTGIAVENPGSGYLYAPYVFIENDPADAYGVADPYFSTTLSGFSLIAGASMEFTVQCPTGAISAYGATGGNKFMCRWMY
jgi:hypothetical protein